jgi:hypothetical protein
MFISGNSETGVPELNLTSIPYMGSPEGLRHFLGERELSKIQEESKSAQQTAAPCERLSAVGVNFVFSQVLDFEGGRAG